MSKRSCLTNTLLILLALAWSPLGSLKAQIKTEQLLSIFPLGGRQGSSLTVKIRGRGLKGTYGIWFDCESVTGEISKVEEIDSNDLEKGEPKKGNSQPRYEVTLKAKVAPSALTGAHTLRLISPQGISEPQLFQVNSDPVVMENDSPHNLPDQPQTVSSPVVVNGQISRDGELDYYSFDVQEGEKLLFEVGFGGSGFEPTLNLYDSTGSWFDPRHLREIILNGEPNSPVMASPRREYRFAKGGRYVVAVGAFLGLAKPGPSYQLRLVGIDDRFSALDQKPFTLAPAHSEVSTWRERDFARRIETNRLTALGSRTSRVPKATHVATEGGERGDKVQVLSKTSDDFEASALQVELGSVEEKEPNEIPAQALEVKGPVLINGAIGRPGDVDYYKFKVETEQRLAFEIECVERQPPNINPRIGILNQTGQEVLSNVYKAIGGDGDDWIKYLEPKVVFTFKTGGEYLLQVRDLTSRYGGTDFRYRLLIRPQIPHVGEVKMEYDRLNLVAGRAMKLTVTSEHEEGYAGEVALSFEHLPQGVRVVPAAETESENPPPLSTLNREKFRPKSQRTTVMLLTKPDAPTGKDLSFVEVKAQSVVEGQLGSLFLVRKIPAIVISPTSQE